MKNILKRIHSADYRSYKMLRALSHKTMQKSIFKSKRKDIL